MSKYPRSTAILAILCSSDVLEDAVDGLPDEGGVAVVPLCLRLGNRLSPFRAKILYGISI